MAPGAVMIAMNGILGANSSPFGTPLRDANFSAYSMGMEPAPLSQQVMPMQNTGGGIGSLLEPIQAHLIQRYNESKVVPLLNNFERQLMQLGSPQGGMAYAGGTPGFYNNPANRSSEILYGGQPVFSRDQFYETLGDQRNQISVDDFENAYQAQRRNLGLLPDPQMTSGGPVRATTMGPGSFGPSITSLQAQQRARVKPGGFDASAYLQ